MARTNDLRYVRTETAIRETFMTLVNEMPVSSITASELCRRAGISRNAFYLHYASVPALYAALVDELVNDVRGESLASAKRSMAIGRDEQLNEEILRAIARHEDLLRALLPPDDGSLAKCLAEGIEEAFVAAALRFGPHGASVEHRLRCACSAWAIVGLVLRWVQWTDRPLFEALPRLEELHASIVEASVVYLKGETGQKNRQANKITDAQP